MQTDEYRRMFELEDRYWWFVGRRRIAIGLLKRFVKNQENLRILDLGCGTGVISGELAFLGDVLSVDRSDVALKFCQERQLKRLLLSDGTQLGVKTDSFDGMIALDIFEHIEDDRAAFLEAIRVLKPGGCLVLSVPAYRFLWGPHDIALMHHRRYVRHEMKNRLESAGFRVVKISYSVFLLFPIVCVVRFFEKRKKGEPKASLAPLPNWMNSLLIGIQAIEAKLVDVFNLPWGSSIIAVAVKS